MQIKSNTEILTRLDYTGVFDEIFDEAKKRFSEKELIDLTMAVIVINGWNRLNIAFRTEAGNYQHGQWKQLLLIKNEIKTNRKSEQHFG